MNLVESASLDERYTIDNSQLHKYLGKAEFDPHSHWYWVCEWIEQNDYLQDMAEALGVELNSADDLQEEDPDAFYRLPEAAQKECAETVIEKVLHHDPADAPSWAYLDNSRKTLLPRNTWLVHFTDSPNEIAHQGFTIGVDQMDKLGLTTYFKSDSFIKKGGGFNFAFLATGRDAAFAASKGKYGRHAVLFQNSGVHAYHNSDEENQVIFWGADVSPKDIIVLENNGGDWHVQARSRLRNGETSLFTGDFESCVKWVIQNQAQYRKKMIPR